MVRADFFAGEVGLKNRLTNLCEPYKALVGYEKYPTKLEVERIELSSLSSSTIDVYNA
jgi:hypothetical protein